MYNQKVQSVLLCLEEEDWRDYMNVLAGHGGLTIEARDKEWLLKALKWKPKSESELSDPNWMVSGKRNPIISHPSLNFFYNSSLSDNEFQTP